MIAGRRRELDRPAFRQRESVKKKKAGAYMDYSLLFAVIFLLLFGLIMVYSASSYEASLKFSDSTYYLKSQLRATAIGIVVMLLVARIDYHFWKKTAIIAYIGSCFLILLVITPLGITRNGARRWLNLGLSLQPAEVAKLGLIIFFATLICLGGKTITGTIRGNFFSLLLAGIPTGLILVITKNMSSAIIVFGIAFFMLFISSPKYSYYLIAVGIAVGLGALVVYVVSNGSLLEGIVPSSMLFRLDRVRAWLHPEAYASSKGYQTLQSLYSIGAGGIFGKGLGQSTQKLGFVPEAQNDMIFSIICEELGIFGAVAVILMFLILLWRFMIVANNAPDEFGSLLVVGVFAHIAIQVVLNIAVVTNTMPNTGITLPFISFGGTSVLFLLMEIGIALNVSRSIRV
ncbi:MAG: cell division protein FtsW [Lachnospiraceae bacterium]|nr:cell division protein FtsW [Lachnospiraceae bacterium]